MSDSPESNCMRTFEFLMNKYKDEIDLDLKVQGSHPDQKEHDSILKLYYTKNLTIQQISTRYHRSKAFVSKIVNRKHKLYKHDPGQ